MVSVALKKNWGTPGSKTEPKYSSVIALPSFPGFSAYCWRPEITSCTMFSLVDSLSPTVNSATALLVQSLASYIHHFFGLPDVWTLAARPGGKILNRCLLGNVLLSKQLKSETNSVSFYMDYSKLLGLLSSEIP